MRPIAESKKKARKDKKKKIGGQKEKPTRPLRGVDEGESDAGGHDSQHGDEDANNHSNNRTNNNSDDAKALPAFTQEHIAQLFDGELDEFVTLASYEIHGNPRQPRECTRTRIQYVVENEVSGDFFRVKHSVNSSTTQRRRPLLFASSMGASASRFSASLHFGKPEAAGGDGSSWSSSTTSGGRSLLRDLETTLVVMCQGILAGLCWMDAFNLSSSDGVIRRDTVEFNKSQQRSCYELLT